MGRYTVIMQLDYPNGNKHVIEIIDDEKRCFSRSNARGRYYVHQKRIGKNYRTNSLLDTYKHLKWQGYKVVEIRMG